MQILKKRESLNLEGDWFLKENWRNMIYFAKFEWYHITEFDEYYGIINSNIKININLYKINLN